MRTFLRPSLLAVLSVTILGVLAPASASASARLVALLEATPVEEGPPASESTGEAGEGAGSGAGAPANEEAPGATTRREAHSRRDARGCHLSVEASAAQVTAGETVTLLGKLTCPTASTAAGAPITVFQRQRHTGGGLNQVAKTSTESDGSYHFTSASIGADSVFVVRSAAVHSVRAVVTLLQLVTLKGPPSGVQLFTHASSGARPRSAVAPTTFTGTVSPFAAGTLVTLQRQLATSGEQWHAVAFARVGPEGSFSFAQRFRIPGQVSVRAIAHPKGAHAVVSEVLTYDVAQNQNPRLTILVSADPLAWGQQLTITGVAAEAANQPVALLASTPGHQFANVAKSTTDGAGAYTFTVSPAQNTSYRVITATTESSVVFEGVRYPLAVTAPPSTAVVGAAVSIGGTLVGAHAGQTVYLERGSAAGLGFHPIGTGAVDAASSYSIVHSFDVQGTYTLRVRVASDAQSVGSTSPQFALVASPPPPAATEPEEPPAAPEAGESS
jgi:hypothetical protein